MPSLWLLVLWLLSVLFAGVFRSRSYAVFAAVVLGVQCLIWLGLRGCVPSNLMLPFGMLQAATFGHYGSLVRPRRRPAWFRFGVSVPALTFSAGTMLAMPWAVLCLWTPVPGWWLPWVLAVWGLWQSFRAKRETVDLALDGESVPGPVRLKRVRGLEGDPLTVVQIADPHLGPFMSEGRLRRICARAVALDPDIVAITGDFLTMESQPEVEMVSRALRPLQELPGRVFACLGNHDLEAIDTVRTACRRNGIRLLVDEAHTCSTRLGAVQIVGLHHRWRERRARLQAAMESLPASDGCVLRIVLLHDPTGFADLPDGSGPLVLAGHTHGGQLGLLSLGLSWTALRVFAPSIPDHGFWARGRDRLYVSRGVGHYGFPLRIGVPGEENLLRVFLRRS